MTRVRSAHAKFHSTARRLGVRDTGGLSDPQIDIYNAAGTIVASNDNWDAALAPQFIQVAAFALTAGSRDAALVAMLPAGNTYTVVVRGVAGSAGEALIEIYDLQ